MVSRQRGRHHAPWARCGVGSKPRTLLALQGYGRVAATSLRVLALPDRGRSPQLLELLVLVPVALLGPLESLGLPRGVGGELLAAAAELIFLGRAFLPLSLELAPQRSHLTQGCAPLRGLGARRLLECCLARPLLVHARLQGCHPRLRFPQLR